MRDSIQRLAIPDIFRSRNYEINNNYRFVEHCIQRVLGRDIYSEGEKLAWVVIVASKGLQGFIDKLLDSEEYLENVGYNTLPYQRHRVLPGPAKGEFPFNIKSPRYNEYHRAQLGFPQIIWQTVIRSYIPQDKRIKAGNPANYLAMVQE